MRTLEIKCDNCQSDITYTGNAEGWRLSLATEALAHYPGIYAVTMMAIPKPLEREYHFCRMGCLGEWMEKERWKDLPERRAKIIAECEHEWDRTNPYMLLSGDHATPPKQCFYCRKCGVSSEKFQPAPPEEE